MIQKMKNFLLNIDLKTAGLLILLSLIAAVFWNSFLIYPIKIFVVILHEFSHGLAAILTGGKILRIIINQDIGGYCEFEGGIFFITASAGYLGSIFWGGLILIIASRTKYDKVLGMVIGVFLVLLSIFYIRNIFGFFFTFFFGVVLFALSYKLSNYIADIIMKFIGLTSCIYVLIDIKEDLISRTNIGSDADYIARSLGWQGLSVPVGVFWLMIAFIVFIFFLLIASQKKSKRKIEEVLK